MTRNRIQTKTARQIATVDDPYNFGVHVRVRRAGHPLAVRLQQVDASKRIRLARELVDAQARLRAAGVDVPSSPSDIATADEKFGAALAAAQNDTPDEIEERASAYVAGWTCDDDSVPAQPEEGRVSVKDVRRLLFGSFGSPDDEHEAVLPRFMDVETRAFIESGDPRLRAAAKIRKSYVTAMEKLLREPVREDFEDAASYLQHLVEWESAPAVEKREKKATALRARQEEKLNRAGLKETLWGGRPVRQALALVIIDAAMDLETKYQKEIGN